ncbi:hypothetical protein Tco_1521091, partial [Tanacetum coccineum]
RRETRVHLYGHEWQSQKGRPFDNFAMRVVLKLAEGGLVTAWEEEELPARIEEKGGHETEGSVLQFAFEKVWMKELPEAVSRRQVEGRGFFILLLPTNLVLHEWCFEKEVTLAN